MNAHQRQLARHVEYESKGWQYAYILEFEVTGILKPLLKAFAASGAPMSLSRAVLLRCSELLLQWRGSSQAGCLSSTLRAEVREHESHSRTNRIPAPVRMQPWL
jgi:hypothetical protein